MTAIAFNVDADLKLYPVGLMRLPHCHAQRPENIQEATGDRLSAFELQDARHVRLCERLLSDVPMSVRQTILQTNERMMEKARWGV
jgi:hypothetical protein